MSLEKKMLYKPLKLVSQPILRPLIKEVRGLHNVPEKGGVVVAANHQSYLDFLLLVSVLKRRVFFLAAEIFFEKPILNLIMKYTKQLKIDRRPGADNSRSIMEAIKLLGRGEVVGIFPEGTRSRTGKMQKPYPGVAMLSRKSDRPVVPVGIDGTYELWPPHKKIPRIGKICKINIGEPYHYYKDPTFISLPHDKVAEHIMKRIADLRLNNNAQKDRDI